MLKLSKRNGALANGDGRQQERQDDGPGGGRGTSGHVPSPPTPPPLPVPSFLRADAPDRGDAAPSYGFFDRLMDIVRLRAWLAFDGERHAYRYFFETAYRLTGVERGEEFAPLLDPGDPQYQVLERLTAYLPVERDHLEELRRAHGSLFSIHYESVGRLRDRGLERLRRMEAHEAALWRQKVALFDLPDALPSVAREAAVLPGTPLCLPPAAERAARPTDDDIPAAPEADDVHQADQGDSDGVDGDGENEEGGVGRLYTDAGLAAVQDALTAARAAEAAEAGRHRRRGALLRCAGGALLAGDWMLIAASAQPHIPADSASVAWLVAGVPATVATVALAWAADVGLDPLMALAEGRSEALRRRARYEDEPDPAPLAPGMRRAAWWCASVALVGFAVCSAVALLRGEAMGAAGAPARALHALTLLSPILAVAAARLWRAAADAGEQARRIAEGPRQAGLRWRVWLVARTRGRLSLAQFRASGVQRRIDVAAKRRKKFVEWWEVRCARRPRVTRLLALLTWITAYRIVTQYAAVEQRRRHWPGAEAKGGDGAAAAPVWWGSAPPPGAPSPPAAWPRPVDTVQPFTAFTTPAPPAPHSASTDATGEP